MRPLLSLILLLALQAFCPFPLALGQESSPPLPDLDAVHPPRLDDFQPEVQEQLRSTRLSVESLIAERRGRDAIEVFGLLCLLYLRYEIDQSADECLGQMRALQPSDFRWPYFLTVLYARNVELEKARASIEAALALRPRDLPALLRAADIYTQLEALPAAESAYRAALEVDPESSAAHFGLGRLAALQGRTEAAIAEFETALPGQPEGSIVHYHLGLAYRTMGDLERARAELAKNRQQALTFPDPLGDSLGALNVSREMIFSRGVEAQRRGSPREAIAAFEEVLAVAPDDAEAHYNLARAQIEVGELQAAESHLRRAIESRPAFFEAHYNLAILLGRRGQEEEAAKHLEQAVEIDPGHLPTRLLWARLLAQQGQDAKAVQQLEAVLSADAAVPGALEARSLLAEELARLGEYSKAADQFSRIAELEPENARAYFGGGMALILAGSYTQAKQALETGLSRLPGNPLLSHLLAQFLATCPDPGIRDGERALELAEKVVAAQLTLEHAETLAMALAELGRFEEAATWQRRVLGQEEATTGKTSDLRRRRLELYEHNQPVRAPWLEAR